MQPNNATLRHLGWLLGGLAMLFVIVWKAPALYTVQGLASYLPLHMVAETFSIVVAMLVFGVAWNAYSVERPGNIMILACALLAVGLIDFAHMLSFKGMPECITPSGPEKAINLWLSARLVAALALFAVALRPWLPLTDPRFRYWLLAASLVVASAVIWLGLAYPQEWPRTFIAGQGLTPFKIGAEYAIITIMLVPAVMFYRQARQPQTYDAASLFAATVITILSELSFTFYSDVADIFNLLGHIYKIVAYFFIYRAVFVASVREPFQRLDAEFAENRRIAKALQTVSLYTRSLIEASLDPLVTINAAGKITDVNHATERVTGRTRSELIGTDFSDYFTEPDKARAGYQQVFLKGAVTDYPLVLRHRDGHVTDVLYNASVYCDEAGEVLGVFAAARDVTERKKAEENLLALKNELEVRVQERTAQLAAANQELEAFSYSVSHDLRTPLRAIDGFSGILLEDYADKLDDEGKRLLNVVRDNTVRMGQLIDDILKFSRAGRLELSYSDIDMEELARSVYDELQPAIAGHEVRVEIEHLPSARGDRAMMRQVFVNLLSNAIKFTRTKDAARIKVGCSVEGNEAIYFVQDNGVGFDMQYVGKLFGVFQRLHGITEFEGTGIGLAIVKRVITRHGGRVWAEGKVGEGATIYFALPVKEKAHG
ncbi:MAG TPA: MASE3 domain-containing protein [Gallionella sp.]|nr:MASE3 domain-containing protein [Gallionella sp.]